MSEEVKILGCNTNFGELQRVFKSRVFVGKKNVRGAGAAPTGGRGSGTEE